MFRYLFILLIWRFYYVISNEQILGCDKVNDTPYLFSYKDNTIIQYSIDTSQDILSNFGKYDVKDAYLSSYNWDLKLISKDHFFLVSSQYVVKVSQNDISHIKLLDNVLWASSLNKNTIYGMWQKNQTIFAMNSDTLNINNLFKATLNDTGVTILNQGTDEILLSSQDTKISLVDEHNFISYGNEVTLWNISTMKLQKLNLDLKPYNIQSLCLFNYKEDLTVMDFKQQTRYNLTTQKEYKITKKEYKVIESQDQPIDQIALILILVFGIIVLIFFIVLMLICFFKKKPEIEHMEFVSVGKTKKGSITPCRWEDPSPFSLSNIFVSDVTRPTPAIIK